MDDLSERLAKSLAVDEDPFLIPQTTDLVADQRDYAFPSDILARMKRLEATFDGTTWVRLLPMDISEYKDTHDETVITSHFGNVQGEAFYDMLRTGIYIYSGSIISVTAGLKLWCTTYPSVPANLTGNTVDLATDPDSTHPGFPRALHELLARGVSIDYKESREKPIPLSERELKYDLDVKNTIDTLKNGDANRSIIGNVPTRYNNGQDL
jgi:hypothetical protein